jgi:hypothetical protein
MYFWKTKEGDMIKVGFFVPYEAKWKKNDSFPYNFHIFSELYF